MGGEGEGGEELVGTPPSLDLLRTWLLTGKNTDVLFRLAGKWTVPAHRLLLRALSPAFATLLHLNTDLYTHIPIPDLDREEFKLLLQFVYTGRVIVGIGQALPLMKAALRFGHLELVRLCRQVLENGLAQHSALRVFAQARKHKEHFWQQLALHIISTHAAELVESPAFLELSVSDLQLLLRQDDLRVRNELQLWHAVLRWAEGECEREELPKTPFFLRLLLQTLLPHIRFPLMTPQDFSRHVVTRDILDKDQLLSVLLLFNAPLRSEIRTDLFLTRTRNYDTRLPSPAPLLILERFQYSDQPVPAPERHFSTQHSMRFKSPVPIWLQSVGLHPLLHLRPSVQPCAQVELKLVRQEEVLLIHVQSLTQDESLTPTTLHHVQLPRPVRIQENVWHTLALASSSAVFQGHSVRTLNGEGLRCEFLVPAGKRWSRGGERIQFQFGSESPHKSNLATTSLDFIPELGFRLHSPGPSLTPNHIPLEKP